MTASRRVVHYLIGYYRVLIAIVDVVIIVVISALTAMTVYTILRDLMMLYTNGEASVQPAIVLSELFLLIVYTEIIRSIVIARRRPEIYLIGIAEAGFVISVKEIITSIVLGATTQLIMPTASTLALAIVLWILYKHVLPHKEERKETH